MMEPEGSCKKRRKKMLQLDEDHDDGVLLLAQENVSVQPYSGMLSLSEAACALNSLKHDADEVQKQAKCFSTPKGLLQAPDTASFKPLSEHDATEVRNQVKCCSAPKGPLQVPDTAGFKPLSAAAEEEVRVANEVKAESSIDSALIDVEGYCVKTEVAPMLQRIFNKHKDIARDCKINDRAILVPILEMICSFCQKLENLSLDIMDTELEDMALIVENFQLMGFDLKWLSKRLKDIPKVKQLVKDCLALKEEKAKIVIKEEELKTMKAERGKARRSFKQRRMALKLEGFLCKRQCEDDSYFLSLV